jgi:outer membrane receptor protein involved in Fe transport
VDARRLHADSDAALGRGAQARNATAWSADAGVVWRALPDLAVSANAGRAWRAPTLFELFSNGPHLGEARYEKGDPTLSPETGRSLDVGVRWGGRRLRVELAGYDNRISDYIYIAPTAQFFHPSPTDSLRIYQHTQADAELTGGELSVEAEVARAVTLRVHIDGVRASNLTTHQPLPLVPPLRGGVAVEWRDGVEVAVESYAKQDRLNPLDVPTAGYTLLHLGGGTAVSLFGRRMRLDLALRNALNTRYRSFLSRYKEFALDPGRNLIVRLSTGDVD